MGRVARFGDAGAESTPAAEARLDRIGADGPAAAVARFGGLDATPADAGTAGVDAETGDGETGDGETGDGEAAGSPVARLDEVGEAPPAAPLAELDAADGEGAAAAAPTRTARFGEGRVRPARSGDGGRSGEGRGVGRRTRRDGAAARTRRTAGTPAADVPSTDTPSTGEGPADDRRTADEKPRRGWGPQQIDPDADPLVAAREICLRLLTDRARTRHELAQALKQRGVPDEASESVLSRFDEVGLIDDAAFAGQYVRSRHTYRGLSRRAIAMELRRKGVDDEVAGEALEEVDPASEERRARELVDRKLRTVPADTPEQRKKAANRLVGMLARKGYGGSIAYRVVREALAAHGTELDDELDSPDL
ncbi:regulatory protein RecX [Pseudonocardia oceani]|uniref:regulatory protein RecX n=1 Tax=Pseudonocardia oceani TaxID=2792013 RepID=UPI0027DF48C0|nr:regulatory protein RecX [Pseudonocardia oceani]